MHHANERNVFMMHNDAINITIIINTTTIVISTISLLSLAPHHYCHHCVHHHYHRHYHDNIVIIIIFIIIIVQIILGNYEQENRKADVFCDNLITELYDSLIRHKLMSDDTGDVKPKRECVYASDMQLFRQDWELLLRKYSAEARGPSKWRVLSESLKVKIIDCSTVIINFVTNDYEKQVAVLHQEVQDSATRLSTVDAEFHVLQDNADQLAARNKELETTVIDLGVKCKAQDIHFTSLSSEHSDLLAKYDEERDVRTRLEVKMEKSSERLAALEGYETSCFELTHEKDALLIALQELEEEVAALKKRKKKKFVIS
jgi:hypothetical protein